MKISFTHAIVLRMVLFSSSIDTMLRLNSLVLGQLTNDLRHKSH